MIDPTNKSFELAVLFGQPVLFSPDQINRAQLPEGIHLNEIRYVKGNPSKPVWIEQKVQENFYGSILSKESIEMTGERSFFTPETNKVGIRPVGDEDFKIDEHAMASVKDYFNGKFELTPEPEANIRVLIVEPLELPRETIIPNTLQSKQEIVEGLIEAVYPFEDQVALVCNDEGKLIGLPLNRRVGGDIIAGTFIVCGIDDRNASFASLSDEQAKRYSDMFKTIEIFIPKGSIPVAESWNRGKRKDVPER